MAHKKTRDRIAILNPEMDADEVNAEHEAYIRTVRYLLRHVYIVGGPNGTQYASTHLSMVERYKEIMSEGFDGMGFRLIYDRGQGRAFVENMVQTSRKLGYRKSLFLLGMRAMWEMMIKQGTIEEDGSARTTISEVWDLIEEVLNEPRPIKVTEVRDIAEGWAKLNICRLEKIEGAAGEDGEDPLLIRAVIRDFAKEDVLRGYRKVREGIERDAQAASQPGASQPGASQQGASQQGVEIAAGFNG